ncbi:MAG: type II toxin-antitoxin system YafQ family toxin [Hyphomicrobiales bacterium]|nr:type II toxin-antitoxin system YafQ family toxin [Hyphomicrobiales bacterium]
MRKIVFSTRFKRDIKRVEKQAVHNKDFHAVFDAALDLLTADQPLPTAQRDHALSGKWAGSRECHIKPDLLLIYRKPDAAHLQLVRLGSHSELFKR